MNKMSSPEHNKAIPPFNSEGNLPVGIHLATIGEILERFSPPKKHRRDFSNLIQDIYNSAVSAGIHKIILAGSYVSAKEVCLDLDGFFYGTNSSDWQKLEKYFYGNNTPLYGIRCDFFVATSSDSYRSLAAMFQRTRTHSERGLIEIPIFPEQKNSPFFTDKMINIQMEMANRKLSSTSDPFEIYLFRKTLSELQNEKRKLGVMDFYNQCLRTELTMPGNSGMGDIQINSTLGTIMTKSPVCLVDYGCGEGRLIHELNTLDISYLQNFTYVGFDFEPNRTIPILIETNFEKKCASCKILKFSEVDKNKEIADFVFAINVLHEIPLHKLGALFSELLLLTKKPGKIIIHDMEHLLFGEYSYMPWSGDDIRDIIKMLGLTCFLRKHTTRSGMSIYTIIVDADKEILMEISAVTDIIVKILEKRISVLIANRESAKKSGDEREYAYCSVSIANAIEQLQRTNTKKEYCASCFITVD